MKDTYGIINSEQFNTKYQSPKWGIEVINKYKNTNIEINMYIIGKERKVYLQPPLNEEGIKTYCLIKGHCENQGSGEQLKVGDIIVLRKNNEVLNLHAIEETVFIVHSLGEDSYNLTQNRSQIAHEVLNKIQEKDSYTQEHCERVLELASRMAITLGYSGNRLLNIRWAARYHDVGKIYIDGIILNKPGALEKDEFEVMKGHVLLGKDLVVASFNEEAFRILAQHHERIDGSGYPYGLKGEEISQEGRILAICDSFDAMVTDRVYRKGKSIDESLQELQELAGTKYDKELVDLFVKMIREQPKKG